MGTRSAFGTQPALGAWIREHLAHAYRLPSPAMEPALPTGDYILTSRLRRSVERGQLAVHGTEAGTCVKRAVASAGDTVAMAEGRLVVNGGAVVEPYVRAEDADPVSDDFLTR